MKRMTVKEVVEYIHNDDSNDDFAFRGDDFVAEVSYRNSRYHGDDATEFELDGVSAIAIASYSQSHIVSAIRQAKKYGANVVLLGGYQINAHEWANDPGECLIQENRVICVVTDA